MTPKEKARQLVDKIRDDLWEKRCVKIYLEDAQLCALILVDEAINAIYPFGQFLGKDYWEEVKEELENL